MVNTSVYMVLEELFGSIKRYWWWTAGGQAPFNWKFRLGGPIGGQADGTLEIYDT